jgi:hypothetical protein
MRPARLANSLRPRLWDLHPAAARQPGCRPKLPVRLPASLAFCPCTNAVRDRRIGPRASFLLGVADAAFVRLARACQVVSEGEEVREGEGVVVLRAGVVGPAQRQPVYKLPPRVDELPLKHVPPRKLQVQSGRAWRRGGAAQLAQEARHARRRVASGSSGEHGKASFEEHVGHCRAVGSQGGDDGRSGCEVPVEESIAEENEKVSKVSTAHITGGRVCIVNTETSAIVPSYSRMLKQIIIPRGRETHCLLQR